MGVFMSRGVQSKIKTISTGGIPPKTGEIIIYQEYCP
jgi:hypothetical protein